MYIQTTDRGLLKVKFINVLNSGASHDFVVALENGKFEYMEKAEILSICDDSTAD
jgi:hypothetical protein